MLAERHRLVLVSSRCFFPGIYSSFLLIIFIAHLIPGIGNPHRQRKCLANVWDLIREGTRMPWKF